MYKEYKLGTLNMLLDSIYINHIEYNISNNVYIWIYGINIEICTHGYNYMYMLTYIRCTLHICVYVYNVVYKSTLLYLAICVSSHRC